MATSSTRRRLAPEERRALILVAAKESIAEEGITAFSLEGVAARAGVTGPLLRHYFGSREGLLKAAAHSLLEEVLMVFVRSQGEPLRDRLASYLDHLEGQPWAQRIWMHADEVHPEIADLVAGARLQLAEISANQSWNSMTERRQVQVIGWIGFVESTVVHWIANDTKNPSLLLDVLMDTADALQINPS